MQINGDIASELKKRGFSVKTSATRKLVLDFEKNEKASQILDFLKNNRYLRIIFQTIYNEIPLTVDETTDNLIRNGKLKEILPKSPSRNIYCKRCNHIISSYNPFTQRKPRRRIHCPKCQFTVSLSDCEDKDEWALTNNQIMSILDKLVLAGLLNKGFMGFCRNCERHSDLEIAIYDQIESSNSDELRGYMKSLYCESCHDPFNIHEIYKHEQVIDKFFGSNGVWLEWYVKNLIIVSNPKIALEQGLEVFNNETGTEADIITLQNGKITVFECKAFSPLKKADTPDIANIFQVLDFADRIFLVTTGKLTGKAKKFLSKHTIDLIEGASIEKIGQICKK